MGCGTSSDTPPSIDAARRCNGRRGHDGPTFDSIETSESRSFSANPLANPLAATDHQPPARSPRQSVAVVTPRSRAAAPAACQHHQRTTPSLRSPTMAVSALGVPSASTTPRSNGAGGHDRHDQQTSQGVPALSQSQSVRTTTDDYLILHSSRSPTSTSVPRRASLAQHSRCASLSRRLSGAEAACVVLETHAMPEGAWRLERQPRTSRQCTEDPSVLLAVELCTMQTWSLAAAGAFDAPAVDDDAAAALASPIGALRATE